MKALSNSNTTNTIIDYLHTFWSFAALNIVFLLTCLPVITIGSALSSLYFVVIREARGESGYLVRTYISEFKKNLKSGTSAFLLLFLAGCILLFNAAFWFFMDSIIAMLIFGIIIAACIAFFLTFLYTFPLLGRFTNSTIRTLKNAFYISITNLKITGGLLLIDSFVLCLCIFLPTVRVFMLLFGFAFVAYCKSFLFIKVFEPYENT